MAERGLSVDHVTIWRWVQRYAPLLNPRIRRELRRPNGSWTVDETYVRVAGSWAYLYRAVDSAGETIEFMLSPKRDLSAAKLFLGLALSASRGIRPRVINVDGHPAYASDLPPWRTVYLLSFSETRFERSAVLRPIFRSSTADFVWGITAFLSTSRYRNSR